MGVRNQVRLVIYRINKKGLEIFLVNTGDTWQIPEGGVSLKTPLSDPLKDEEGFIRLDPVQHSDGRTEHAWAVEGDYHNIPTIRSIIKEDLRIVKDQIKQHIPDLEKGTFFAVKEAFKKVLPHEYTFLKELKDVLLDRNQAKYI